MQKKIKDFNGVGALILTFRIGCAEYIVACYGGKL
jgi:hypothetical protein